MSPNIFKLHDWPIIGIGVHLTTTKRRRVTKYGTLTTEYMQMHFRVCGILKKCVCSECSDTNIEKYSYTYVTKNGKMCFPEHTLYDHSGL